MGRKPYEALNNKRNYSLLQPNVPGKILRGKHITHWRNSDIHEEETEDTVYHPQRIFGVTQGVISRPNQYPATPIIPRSKRPSIPTLWDQGEQLFSFRSETNTELTQFIQKKKLDHPLEDKQPKEKIPS